MPSIKWIVQCVWVCVCVCVCYLLSHVGLDSLRPHGLQSASLLCPWNSPRILEWVAIHFSKGSSQLRIKPWSPALQADSLPSKPPGNKALYCCYSKEELERGLIFKTYVDTSKNRNEQLSKVTQFQGQATLTEPLTGCTLCLSRHFHFLLHMGYIFLSSSLLTRPLCLLTTSIPSQLELAFGILAGLTPL